jgi:uncharacterized iron-regulated membrane protein
MKMLRKISSTLHLYLGLVTGLLLVPIGLSGSILVYDDAIDRALNPELLVASPEDSRVSLQSVEEVVREAFPHEDLVMLELPSSPTDVHEILLAGEGRRVYVNPYSGEILGSRLPGEGLTGFLFELHAHLLAGETGEQVGGILGFVLILISVTGLILWWRGKNNLRRGLTIQWRLGTRRLNYDLHNVLGAGSAAFLIVLAFTGAALVFYHPFMTVTHSLTATSEPPPPPTSSVQPAADQPSLDALTRKARRALPDAEIRRIAFPRSEEEAFLFRMRQPEEVHQNGMSMVYLNRYDGELLRVDDALQAPLAGKLGQWLYPVHTGFIGDWWGRLIVFLVGLLPAVLFVTGFLIWRWPGNHREATPSLRAVPVQFPD